MKRAMLQFRLIASVVGSMLFLGPMPVERTGRFQALSRDLTLPVPLFASNSAWNQTATGAAVLPEGEQQIRILDRHVDERLSVHAHHTQRHWMGLREPAFSE